MAKPIESFGQYLQFLRKSKGYLPKQLADILVIDRANIYNYESGENLPVQARLEELILALKLCDEEASHLRLLFRQEHARRIETKAQKLKNTGIGQNTGLVASKRSSDDESPIIMENIAALIENSSVKVDVTPSSDHLTTEADSFPYFLAAPCYPNYAEDQDECARIDAWMDALPAHLTILPWSSAAISDFIPNFPEQLATQCIQFFTWWRSMLVLLLVLALVSSAVLLQRHPKGILILPWMAAHLAGTIIAQQWIAGMPKTLAIINGATGQWDFLLPNRQDMLQKSALFAKVAFSSPTYSASAQALAVIIRFADHNGVWLLSGSVNRNQQPLRTCRKTGRREPEIVS